MWSSDLSILNILAMVLSAGSFINPSIHFLNYLTIQGGAYPQLPLGERQGTHGEVASTSQG